MTESRFPRWQPPSCPVLPQFPGRQACRADQLAMLRVQYPDCERLFGGGFCPVCVADVLQVKAISSSAERSVTQQRGSDLGEIFR